LLLDVDMSEILMSHLMTHVLFYHLHQMREFLSANLEHDYMQLHYSVRSTSDLVFPMGGSGSIVSDIVRIVLPVAIKLLFGTIHVVFFMHIISMRKRVLASQSVPIALNQVATRWLLMFQCVYSLGT